MSKNLCKFSIYLALFFFTFKKCKKFNKSMGMKTSNLHYPETILFIGAGATAQLGMPQSDLQSKIFRALVENKKNY
jgi:hypothetical protein